MSMISTPLRSGAKHWLADLLTAEYCAKSTRYLQWLARPLSVLAFGAISSLLCGIFVAPQGYALLAAVGSVIGIGMIWPWVGIRGLDCELEFGTQRCSEGRATSVDVVMVNRWPWPVWGLAIEKGFFAGEGTDGSPATALARVGGWSRTTFRWDFTPRIRGVYPTMAPELVTEFPFGLWKARRKIPVDSRLVVWPQTFSLPSLPLHSKTPSFIGEATEAHLGCEGERIGVREYRLGDSPRLVHWAKTARYDRVIVCEQQGASTQEAHVVVDVSPEVHIGTGEDSSLQWAVRIAASICQALIAQNARVSLSIGDNCTTVHSGRRGLESLFDALATFDVAGAEAQGRGRESDVASRKRGRPTSGALIHVTTDLSSRRLGQTVLLRADSFAGHGRCSSSRSNAWMTIDGSASVRDQVLRGWRVSTREVKRGA